MDWRDKEGDYLAPRRMRYRLQYLSRWLVLPLALIRHLPQQIVLGPGEVGHFDDHLWPHPCTRDSLSGEPKRLSRGGGSASAIFGPCHRLVPTRKRRPRGPPFYEQ